MDSIGIYTRIASQMLPKISHLRRQMAFQGIPLQHDAADEFRVRKPRRPRATETSFTLLLCDKTKEEFPICIIVIHSTKSKIDITGI